MEGRYRLLIVTLEFSAIIVPAPTIYDVSGSPLFGHNHHFYFAEFIISGSSSSEGTPARTDIFNQYLTAAYHIFTDTGSQADYHNHYLYDPKSFVFYTAGGNPMVNWGENRSTSCGLYNTLTNYCARFPSYNDVGSLVL